MAWDFSTDPEYQRKLDWARDFVRTQKDRPLAGVRVVLTRPKEVGLRDPQRTAPRQFGRTELARCTRGDGFVVPLSRRERYHHGDLRRARVEAALDIAREQDADRISLREASRRADVSHAAAYRHFTDREALLVAASAEALAGLARAMEDGLARASSSREALRAVGRAYVTYAIEEPGLFRLAFNHHPPAGPEREAARGRTGRDPGELLSDALDRLQTDGLLDPERHAGAQALAWSAVHGLASLILDGPLSELDPTDRLEKLESLLRSIEAGIVSSGATQPR